jgi:hypothetical protein
MDDREVFNRLRWYSDVRNPFRGRRQRREKRERKMAHSISKLRTMGPVPGIDGVERLQLRDARSLYYPHQIQTGIGDGAHTIGKANQGQHRARRPDFGVICPSRFQRRERKNNIADRARPNEQSALSG